MEWISNRLTRLWIEFHIDGESYAWEGKLVAARFNQEIAGAPRGEGGLRGFRLFCSDENGQPEGNDIELRMKMDKTTMIT